MIKIAYKNLQHYRYTVHKYLDGIWCFGNRKGVARTNMYKWLAVQMNLPLEDTHVKYFTRAQCKKAISILRPKYIQINGHDLVYIKKKKKKKNKINKEDKKMEHKTKTISRTEYFEAAHLLPNYDGPCANLHGHSYKFTATVSGPQKPPFGMIMDYKDLKKVMKAVMPDHMYLHFKGNEISEDIVSVLDKYGLKYMTFPEATSAENMTPYIAEALQNYITNELGLTDIKVVNVEIHETLNSRCNSELEV